MYMWRVRRKNIPVKFFTNIKNEKMKYYFILLNMELCF